MHFNQQHEAVLYVIWQFRILPPGSDQCVGKGKETKQIPEPPEGWKPGQLRKLNQEAIVQKANMLLVKRAPEGTKPKEVGRNLWTHPKASAEWKGIYQAILGDKATEVIPTAVEDAIAQFDKADETGVNTETVEKLLENIAEKERTIQSLIDSREDFENKAYTRQFIDAETYELMGDLRKNYAVAQQMLHKGEETRIKVEQRNRKLNETLETLKKDLDSMTMEQGDASKKRNPPSDCSPKLSELDANSAGLMKDYRRITNEAWDAMVAKAGKKAPDYIFLVFHKFNININKFISTNIPIPRGVKSYIFACYLPLAIKRENWFATACKLTKSPHIKPVVFIVEGDPNSQAEVDQDETNVIQFPTEAPDVVGKLHALAIKESDKADPYNPVQEGFRQVWIERSSHE